MFMEKRQRLVDQVRIKILAQVIFDVAGHAYEQASLQEKKKAAHRAGGKDF